MFNSKRIAVLEQRVTVLEQRVTEMKQLLGGKYQLLPGEDPHFLLGGPPISVREAVIAIMKHLNLEIKHAHESLSIKPK